MDRYSRADRTALPRALELLHAHCDCALSPDGPAQCPARPGQRRLRLNGETYCAFQPGSAIEVGPDGRIAYAMSPPGSADYAGGFYAKRAAGRLLDPGRALPQLRPYGLPSGPEARAPDAPLPSGFRVSRAGRGASPRIRFAVPARGGTQAVDVGCPPMSTVSVPIPRGRLAGHVPDHTGGIELALARHEDRQCLDQLLSLRGDSVFECRLDSTLSDLADHVGGLNSGRPPELRLDTVFLPYGAYVLLFGNSCEPSPSGGYPDYRNMASRGGITFLQHDVIPHGFAYAASSAQGPVFVHGPATLSCAEGGLEIKRDCALALPPEPGVPGIPWGVRIGVRTEWTRRGGARARATRGAA